MQDRLTLGYLTLDIDPLATVEAAGRAGFRSVGIRITGRRLADAYPPVIGRPEAIAAIRRRLDDDGLRLSNVSAYHFHPDVTRDHLARVLETVAALGAGTVIANCYLDDRARLVATLCDYCEMARGYGIRVAIEFMRYSAIKSLADAEGFLRQADQANAGVLIDALHLDRAGETPADIGRIDPGRIFFAQLCDAMRRPGASEDELRVEARTARLCPGHGELPLREFLAALPEGTEIEIETPRPELRHLDPAEQARRALEASQAFFERTVTHS